MDTGEGDRLMEGQTNRSIDRLKDQQMDGQRDIAPSDLICIINMTH